MGPAAGLFHQQVFAGLDGAAGVGGVLAFGAADDDCENRCVAQQPVDVVQVGNACGVGLGFVSNARRGAWFVDAGQVNLREVPQPSQLPGRVRMLRAEHAQAHGRLVHVGRSTGAGG